MTRYGISIKSALGISMPQLRDLAKGTRSHPLAQQLWRSGIHEARILAGMIADSAVQSRDEMDAWTADFDSWDLCDQVCSNLFVRSRYALDRTVVWAQAEPEFVRRAGFVMMAALAVHAKTLPDDAFLSFFPLMVHEACDERNYVKKAINWALRQTGKRSPALCKEALRTAEQLAAMDTPSARWIGKDAMRELKKSCRKG